jgi:hypothetical protein
MKLKLVRFRSELEPVPPGLSLMWVRGRWRSWGPVVCWVRERVLYAPAAGMGVSFMPEGRAYRLHCILMVDSCDDEQRDHIIERTGWRFRFRLGLAPHFFWHRIDT